MTESDQTRLNGLSLTVAVFLSSILFSTLSQAQNAPVERVAAARLSMEHARERGARVSSVAYHIEFALSADEPEYSGEVTISFNLSDASAPLTLDFTGGTVGELSVNGQASDFQYNGFYITVPGAALDAGRNEIKVAYARPYSSDGSGLYRFIDPEDGRAYLYTDFEPYDQNRLFPSFDQPDLKAVYSSEVRAPASWQVISVVSETRISEDGDERVWTFPESAPISTYIYALHAGDYAAWESSAGDIPLRLFARQSLAPYIHPEDWFGPTRQGFEYFQDYFDIAYPFGKYDQVIVPHFNAGAMENVGAVTFSERYLSRGAVTRQDRRAIASVILHEMAHMWFGDLVTMDWWNGLWLNESFATVMSVFAMVNATEFTDEWLESFRDTVAAYGADERDTTHPIEQQVADTDGAFAIFDRITYEKGSAVLVQLNHLVGPDTFSLGVSNYLREHAYGNTEIGDFLGAISDAAGIDLDPWAQDWLLAPGTNGLQVQMQCAGGMIDSLTLVQSAPQSWPTLRTHRTQLGLYDFGRPVGVRTIPVTYSGETTPVPEARGQPCPDMVYPNHGDWDFVRVRLEPDVLGALADNLHNFEDPLTRLMLWQSVWDMALDARIDVTSFIEFALDNLDRENDEAIIRHVLGSVQGALGYMSAMDDATQHLSVLGPRVERWLWNKALVSAPGSDLQQLLLDTYINTASTRTSLDRLTAFLDSEAAVPPGITIDQDRRWNILRHLSRSGHGDIDTRLAAERERDQTDEGRLLALGVHVSRPNAALKARQIEALLDPAQIPAIAEFRTIAASLFPTSQLDLQLANAPNVLDNLERMSETRDSVFHARFVAGLLGPGCSADYADMLDAKIEAAEDLPPIVVRTLKDSRFETLRCVAIADRLDEA